MISIINKYRSLSQVRKNILSGTILAGGIVILTVFSFPIYLHYLGVEQYGLWSILSVVLAFSQLGNLGLISAIVKSVGGEYWRRNFKAITEYTTTAYYLLMIPSTVIIFILVVFNNYIIDFLKIESILASEASNIVPLIGLLSVFIFVVHIAKGSLEGVGRIDISNYTFLLGRVIQIGIAVLLLILDYGIWSLYISFLVFYIFIFAIYFLLLRRRYSITIFKIKYFNKDKMKKMFYFGGTMLGTKILAMLMQPFTKVIISRYIGLSGVAYFDISLKVVNTFRSLFERGLRAIMPKVSEINERAQSAIIEIRKIYNKSAKLILYAATPAFFLFFVFASIILKIWLGSEFNTNILFGVRVFLLFWYLNLYSTPAFYIFMGVGKVRYCFMTHLIQSSLNFSVILLLIFLSMSFDIKSIILIYAISPFVAAAVLVISYFRAFKTKDVFQIQGAYK